MPRTEVVFLHETEYPSPFLLILHDYTCNGKEGIVKFDGFYRVNNTSETGPYTHTLPQQLKLFVRRLEDIPTLILRGEATPVEQVYRTIDEHVYTVEVYKYITHTNFQHLNTMSVYFRIIKTNESS